jgi:hypothetical protein
MLPVTTEGAIAMEFKAYIEKHVTGIACSLCLFLYFLMLVLSFSRATVWYFESHGFGFAALSERLLWPLPIMGWLLLLVFVPAYGLIFAGLLIMTVRYGSQKKTIPFLIFLTLLGAFFCLYTWGIWTRVP